MIKLCGKIIAISLKLIFRSMLQEGDFPNDWKKNNVVPIHKRDAKNLITDYRSISLLPIFSKVFERHIFNSFFDYFIYKTSDPLSVSLASFQLIRALLNSCQLRMKSTKALIYNPPYDIRGTFFDIAKAFDKVWFNI